MPARHIADDRRGAPFLETGQNPAPRSPGAAISNDSGDDLETIWLRAWARRLISAS
jgi:hypothetical protein